MYKMKDVVKSYKSKHKQKNETMNVEVKIDDSLEDFEDQNFPSERPNQEVPIPHKMYSLRKKSPNKINAAKESNIAKNETTVTLKEPFEDSFNIWNQTQKKVKESTKAIDSHHGEKHKMTVNKFKPTDFNHESPIPKKVTEFDFEHEEKNQNIEQLSTPKRIRFENSSEENNFQIRWTMKQVEQNPEENMAVNII